MSMVDEIANFIRPDILARVRKLQKRKFQSYALELGFTYDAYMRHLDYVTEHGITPFFVGNFLDKDVGECEAEYWHHRDITDYEVVYGWKEDVLEAVKTFPESITQSIIERGLELVPKVGPSSEMIASIMTGIPIVCLPELYSGSSYHLSSRELGVPHIRSYYGSTAALRDMAHLTVQELFEGQNLENQTGFKLTNYSPEFLANIRNQLDYLKQQRLFSTLPSGIDAPLSRRNPTNEIERYLKSVGATISYGARSFLYLHELGHFIYNHDSKNGFYAHQEMIADSFAIHILHKSDIRQRYIFLTSIQFHLLIQMYVNNDLGEYSLRDRFDLIQTLKKVFTLKRALVADVFILPLIKILCDESVLEPEVFDTYLKECHLAVAGQFDLIPYDVDLRHQAEDQGKRG